MGFPIPIPPNIIPSFLKGKDDKDETCPQGAGVDLNSITALDIAIAGVQRLQAAAIKLRTAADQVVAAKVDIDQTVLDGPGELVGIAEEGIVSLNTQAEQLKPQIAQAAATAVTNAIRSIKLLENLTDSFLALIRQGE